MRRKRLIHTGIGILLSIVLIHSTLLAQNENEKLKPTEDLALFDVTVADKEGTPRPYEIVRFISVTTGEKFKFYTGADGKGQVLLPEGDKYYYEYKVLLEYVHKEPRRSVPVPKTEGAAEYEFELRYWYTYETSYTLNNVFFDTGKSSLRKESYKELKELLETMKIKKNMEIELSGHTDNVGSEESNLALSQARADAVKNYLVSQGIPASRIVAKGYGETKPVASNDTDAGRQSNRRTELTVIKK